MISPAISYSDGDTTKITMYDQTRGLYSSTKNILTDQ